jgi:4-phospho-D-threonate 3-dehydrogenase / 4-phospho-D-erythronate 3-dehydrogenase
VSTADKPIVAVTMGDPAGVGPELVVKSLADAKVRAQCRPFVIGDLDIMQRAVTLVGTTDRVVRIGSVAEATHAPGVIEVLEVPGGEVVDWRPSVVDKAFGKVAGIHLAAAFELGERGAVDAVVCAPMNKQALHDAGYDYLDELEYLAAITNRPDAKMVAVIPGLWTVTVTGHVSFRTIPDLITRERVLSRIELLSSVLVAFGVERPRVGVAALNVHAGEGGLFGREEMDHISPAIADARARGINAIGPVPADAVFVHARQGRYDGLVCMYHDQANLGRKLLATRRGATIYHGLAVPGATTAHGVAFDIAWQGIAEPTSIIDCFEYAARLARMA